MKKEVYWVFSNLTRKATLPQINHLCEKGMLAVFVSQMICENSDVETLT